MPWFRIQKKATDLLFHLWAANPKSIENWKRYDALKFLKGGGIGGHECVRCCDEGQRGCGWWWRLLVIWKGLKVVLMSVVGWSFVLFVTLATCGRKWVIKWPVWPIVNDWCLKFCFVGHPGPSGPSFGVRLIFKYTCSNCNLQSSPWPLRHSILQITPLLIKEHSQPCSCLYINIKTKPMV